MINYCRYITVVVTTFVCVGCMSNTKLSDRSLVIGAFNVSMDASNYSEQKKATGQELANRLATDEHQQIKNIAQIIQRVRPEIILLNEFDYGEDSAQRIENFRRHYLNRPQGGEQAIDYPYSFTAPVNTGVYVTDNKLEKHGYGWFPGHYGMVILSQYPIVNEQIRTFQKFLWKDMPNSLMTTIFRPNGSLWYDGAVAENLRLSSKSHWDVPIDVNGKTIHILASHPTPPSFDGPEDRNGKRNADELRFWHDYIVNQQADYIYDDKGQRGGFSGQRFVLAGDLNASAVEGSGDRAMASKLLTLEQLNDDTIPSSAGGQKNREGNQYAVNHTAYWGMRADYVVPSRQGITVNNTGIFWPLQSSPLHALVATRKASSDHRLVWIDVSLH